MNLDAAQGWSLIITTSLSALGTFYSVVRIKRNTVEVIKAKEAAEKVEIAVVETKDKVVEVKRATEEIHILTNSNYTEQKAEITELKNLLATAMAVSKAAEVTRVTLASETASNLSATQGTVVTAPEECVSQIIKP